MWNSLKYGLEIDIVYSINSFILVPHSGQKRKSSPSLLPQFVQKAIVIPPVQSEGTDADELSDATTSHISPMLQFK